MSRYCLALDLINDPDLINEYELWHKDGNGWPEITQSIIETGIIVMEIYRTGNRLFMIMETNESFNLEEKVKKDANNPKVRQWEELMSRFQQPLPWAKDGEKWILMNKLFSLAV
jgi:L-rhamnose mutarotase